MSSAQLVLFWAALGAMTGLAGCGSGETLVSISVTPSEATATVGETVQFTATGKFIPRDCYKSYVLGTATCSVRTLVLSNASWDTTDRTSTQVNSRGLATCLLPTQKSAKIIAEAPGYYGDDIGGLAELTCN